MKPLSEKQMEISKRRDEILPMLIVHNEKEIGKLLGVSNRTIVNDVAALKKSANEWVDNLPRFIVIHAFKTIITRSIKIGGNLEESFDHATDNFEKTALSKEIRATDEFVVSLLDKPTLYALKMIMEKMNVQES